MLRPKTDVVSEISINHVLISSHFSRGRGSLCCSDQYIYADQNGSIFQAHVSIPVDYLSP